MFTLFSFGNFQDSLGFCPLWFLNVFYDILSKKRYTDLSPEEYGEGHISQFYGKILPQLCCH